jgi:hypothetical protein
MNKISFVRIFLLVLSLALVLAALASCVEKPEEAVEEEWTGKESFAPSNGIFKNTEELAERYGEYKENAALAFTASEKMSEESFTVSQYEGGVKIDSYKGSDAVVVIPDTVGGATVTAIGGGAFKSDKLRAVYVPDSVKYIESGAFSDSENLSTLRLPFVGDGKEITHLGHIFGTKDHSTHPTGVPVSLDMVILGEGSGKIAANAFAGCKSLSAVILPDSIEEIGDFAFYECRDLVYLDLGNGAEKIGEYALGYCTSLYSVSLLGSESIGLGALYGCNGTYSLTLPFVGGSESKNCYIGYIFGAEVADHNDEYVPRSLYRVRVEGCKKIPDRAFASCAYIGEILLGEGIESVGVRAFYSCRSLVEFSLPESLKSVGDDAFFGCDNLEAVDLGGAVSIGMQAFYGCEKLASVKLTEGVTEIKPSTFALCTALKTVELGGVKKIGKDAFFGCSSLTPVDLTGIEVAEGNELLAPKSEAE